MNLTKYLALALLSSSVMYAQTQKMTVQIMDRQTHETNYTYQVPGYSHTTTNENAGCSANAFGNSANSSCSGSSNTNTVTRAPQTVSFNVTGATFSLLLPDQRIAVVNCSSKFQERFAGPVGNRRSCRMPLVDELEAEFKGKNAKLEWIVSLDGKKMESETYTILGVFPPQRPAQTEQRAAGN